MRVKNKTSFWIGVAILIFLVGSYLVDVQEESGSNYTIETPLLGLLVFHNAFILSSYILISIGLILHGLSFKRKNMKGGKNNE